MTSSNEQTSHFIVQVPHHEKGDVHIIERKTDMSDGGRFCDIERSKLGVRKWKKIKPTVANELRQRVARRDNNGLRFAVGENMIDYLAGQELCVLAWAAELADEERMNVVMRNWLALTPHDRRWLFRAIAKDPRCAHGQVLGWRAALQYALEYDSESE